MPITGSIESRVLLDLLFEDEAVGRCLVAPDGTVLRANERWLRSTGLSLDQVMGADLVALLPGTRDLTLALHARARAGHHVEVPPQAVILDGRETWWEGSIDPVPMEGGTGLLIAARERPSRRPGARPPAGGVAPQDEERFRFLAEAMAQIVCVLEPDATPRYVNSAWTAFSGLDLPATVRVGWPGVLHPDDAAAALRCRERVLASGRSQDVELRYRAAAGNYRWFLSRLAPVVEDGQVVQLIGAAMDIEDRLRAEHDLRRREEDAQRRAAELQAVLTERKRDEEALRRSNEQLRAVQEAARIGFWDWNLVSGELVWSDQCKALFGLPVGAVMSHAAFLAATHPEDRSRVDEAVRQAQETGQPYDVELRTVHPDGSVRWIASKGQAYRDAAGAPTRMSGMALDVTERRRMEAEILLADQRKSEFLGVLSHELRNPLAPIRNSVYLLEHAPADSEQATRAKAVIRRQTEHLTRLVDDLLDVTRISRGKIALQRTRFDLREIVWRTADDLRPSFAQAGVALEVECGPEPIWLEADATRISQLVANLLHNAVKFTPGGGRVVVRAGAGEGGAELRVRDTGVGMERDAVQRMFEPFAQADRTLARSDGGLGLGLALVKGLVELHGGSVQAHSEGIGKGAEFVVVLPLSLPPEPQLPFQRIRPAAVPLDILLIEDNLDAGDTLADILTLDGHRVRVARDAATGLAQARRRRPDVILCDIGLPDMSGYEVAQAIRRDPGLKGLRLVALSGYAQPEDQLRARRAGFDVHLPKPPPLERLMAVLGQGSGGAD